MARHRALVVDDNLDAAHALGFLIEDLGFEVSFAATGDEALRAAALKLPDVILLDIGLPNLNGWDVALQIRSSLDLKRTLIIAVTGYGTAADMLKSDESGIDHHFTKPATFADLEPLLVRLKANPPLSSR